MEALTSLFAPFVQHASIAAAGTLLVSIPIVIHFINRMRYRRVRFAAMEFLLASQKRNRRRLLIEQLILLLLRILLVLGIAFLIARMTLDPSQLSMLTGAKSHHVALLDDTGSMQDRWGETSAWNEGIDVVRKLVADGASRPNTQRFTLLLMSRPNEPVFSQELVNNEFVTRLETRLEALQRQGTYRSANLIDAFDAGKKLLAEDKAAMKTLHVISDFRAADWNEQAAIAGAVADLDKAGVTVNFVRVVGEQHANLGIVELDGPLHSVAVNVPLRLRVKVKNFGQQVAKDVRVTAQLDGQPLNVSVYFQQIGAGETEESQFEVRFDTAGPHRLRLTLEPDSVEADNTRFLAVNVPPSNKILVIDGDPSGDEAFFISAALAADPTTTGLEPLAADPDYLRKHPLRGFQSIWMLNVPQLPEDAIEPLRQFVEEGGGLVWFVGDLVRPQFYNEKLYLEGKGLFPVPLGVARRPLPPDDGTNPGPDLRVTFHPIFEDALRITNPQLNAVLFTQYYPTPDSWEPDDNVRKDGVRTFASLRNKRPVAFEHTRGKGRIITYLTAAASLDWNTWRTNPSFITTVLDTQKYVARQDTAPQRKFVGQPIELSLDPSEYTGEVEVRSPKLADVPWKTMALPRGKKKDGAKAGTGKAGTEKTADEKTETPQEEPAAAASAEERILDTTYNEAVEPGVYEVILTRGDETKETRLFSYSAPPSEGEMQIATNEDIRQRVGEEVRVEIQDAGKTSWIQGRETKSEIRTILLGLLAIILLAEQLMACRLSFHPKASGAKA